MIADTAEQTRTGVFIGEPGTVFTIAGGCAIVVLSVDKQVVKLGITAENVDTDRSKVVKAKSSRTKRLRRFRRQD